MPLFQQAGTVLNVVMRAISRLLLGCSAAVSGWNWRAVVHEAEDPAFRQMGSILVHITTMERPIDCIEIQLVHWSDGVKSRDIAPAEPAGWEQNTLYQVIPSGSLARRHPAPRLVDVIVNIGGLQHR